jgi:1-acyl-sn-glycerol-3-phosphate acyltransferase
MPEDHDPRRRGNAFSMGLARLVLRLTGWSLEGSVPPDRKMVAIVAPHTSNWDFILGAVAMTSLGLGFGALAKDSLFWPPLGRVMRWLGCVPVNRRRPSGVVESAIEALQTRDGLILAVTPEGTRRKSKGWKTGFHRIALGAGVPVWPTVIDYRRKVVAFHSVFQPTQDVDADVVALQALYSADMARFPANYSC